MCFGQRWLNPLPPRKIGPYAYGKLSKWKSKFGCKHTQNHKKDDVNYNVMQSAQYVKYSTAAIIDIAR